MTRLRSTGDEAMEARRWMAVSDDRFGRGLAGLGGQTFVAVDRAELVPLSPEAADAHLQAAGERLMRKKRQMEAIGPPPRGMMDR